MSDYDGEDMNAEELAAQLGEPTHVPKEPEFPEEEIYAVNARIKNMAVEATGNNLTPVGIQLANSYTHVILELYKFAHTLPVADCVRLKSLVRSQEEFVGKLVAAVPPPPRVKSNIVPALDPRGEPKQYPEEKSDEMKIMELYLKLMEQNKPDYSKSTMIHPNCRPAPLPPSSNNFWGPVPEKKDNFFVRLFKRLFR